MDSELQVKEKEEEEEEEEEVKPKSKKAAPTNGKSTEVNAKRSKKAQEEEEEEEEEQPKTTKKVKTEAPAKKEEPQKKDQGNKNDTVIEDFDEEEEEEEEEQEEKPQIKTKSVADGLKNLKNGATNGQNKNQAMEEENNKNNNNKTTTTAKRFSYVDPSIIDEIPEEFRDNSFEVNFLFFQINCQAKFKFGQGGDEFGALGNEKLKDTRGKGFKKEKGKLKNKNFCGGGGRIDTNVVNSIKFKVDDD